VKLSDLDGKVKYSNVVTVKLSQKFQVTTWPNPFQTSITISICADKETTINIKLIDVSGKVVRNISQPVAKGLSQVALQNVQNIPAGMYILEITDEKSGSTSTQKLIKN
jgi:hypothetical protein